MYLRVTSRARPLVHATNAGAHEHAHAHTNAATTASEDDVDFGATKYGSADNNMARIYIYLLLSLVAGTYSQHVVAAATQSTSNNATTTTTNTTTIETNKQTLEPNAQLREGLVAAGSSPADVASALPVAGIRPVLASEAPRSEREHVLEMYKKFFTQPRSHDDQQQKEYVREGVIMRLRELGFETSFLQKSRFEFRRRPAFCYNMISVLPGRHRQTRRDKIVLLGAHWDSYTKAPGVDDNGSGSTCLLEIARIISANRCKFNHTVMLVWFDYEEQGKYGSEFFVNDYLFPYELEKYGSKFIGAYILDMILVRDKENNTQTLPLSLKSVSYTLCVCVCRRCFRRY